MSSSNRSNSKPAPAASSAIFSLRPTAALQPFVDRIWGWESSGYTPAELPVLLPGTGAEVFFHEAAPFKHILNDQIRTLEAAHLICVRHEPLPLVSDSKVRFVAVRFRAGAIHRFTHVPGRHLIDGTFSATELWGRDATELHQCLLNSRSIETKTEILEAFLLQKLDAGGTDPLVESAIGQIYARCTEISIEDLTMEFGVSRRALERRFKALTGQPPVEIRRLSRLQKVMRQLLLGKSTNLLDAVLDYGFYDQSHFYREFKSLGLGSPRRHIATARERTHFYKTPWSDGDKPTLSSMC